MRLSAVNGRYVSRRGRDVRAGVSDGRQVHDVAVENLLIPEEKQKKWCFNWEVHVDNVKTWLTSLLLAVVLNWQQQTCQCKLLYCKFYFWILHLTFGHHARKRVSARRATYCTHSTARPFCMYSVMHRTNWSFSSSSWKRKTQVNNWLFPSPYFPAMWWTFSLRRNNRWRTTDL